MLESLTELREILTTTLLKDMIQDTDEHPDEEIHRQRSWEGPECRSVCPCGVGVCHSPSVDVFTSTVWKLSESGAIGVLWRLPLDQLLIPFPASLPL